MKAPVLRLSFFLALFLAAALSVPAQQSQRHQLVPVASTNVTVNDAFWAPKMKVWRTVTIKDCWDKFEKEGAIANFDNVRDGKAGEHKGQPWYDGLIYEMIRGSADFMAMEKDPELEQRIDGYIERIATAAAKDPDGYLNTYTLLKEPDHRWGLNGGNNRWQHDLYNASAMVEAAVHYYRATGKTRLLKTATKLANHMADTMGPPPKKNIVPGHSLGEEALVKLYLLFKEHPELKPQMGVPVEENRYLKLSEFWIENRGNHEGRKSYDTYAQDHKPVLQQETIEGHAVRATLLLNGMTYAAMVNGREDYLQASKRLWENMVYRKMYVIGGLGSIAGHEGFGPDYELPNNGYLETCAAIGAGFFHQNMNMAFGEARYADELERVLFNGILSGVSLKGDRYFYENPLEAGRDRKRWEWHGCPCCPPMFLKIMGALPGFIYAQDEGGLYVNQYIGSSAQLKLRGQSVLLKQVTRYPWDGEIRLEVSPEHSEVFELLLRLPGWCRQPQLKINGKAQEIENVRGYARVRRQWKAGDLVQLSLPMPVERVRANPRVQADEGKVALQRGPLVYCLEGPNRGERLWQVRNYALKPESRLTTEDRPDQLGGITVIKGEAVTREPWPQDLYRPESAIPSGYEVKFTAIPYYANANGEPGELVVWLPEAASNPASETSANQSAEAK